MVSQRGQEEAPFELLISVIIMGFVILLGMQAMNFVNSEQCKANINYNANQLKIVLEKVVNGGMGTLVFSPRECFQKPKDRPEMRLVVVKDALQCGRLCGGAITECLVFNYVSEEYTYQLCFKEVSPQVTFNQGAPCEERDAGKYNLIDMKSDELGIPRGAYEFVNKSSYSDSFPLLCAYLRKG